MRGHSRRLFTGDAHHHLMPSYRDEVAGFTGGVQAQPVDIRSRAITLQIRHLLTDTAGPASQSYPKA